MISRQDGVTKAELQGIQTMILRRMRVDWRAMVLGGLTAVMLLGTIVASLAVGVLPVSAQSGVDIGKMAVVGLDGATVQDAPGGRTLVQLSAGEVMTALGRTEDSKYLQIETERGVKGWTLTSSVVIFGVAQLPVVEPPQPPTATPTASPTPLPPTPTRQPSPTPANTAAASAAPTQAAAPTPIATTDATTGVPLSLDSIAAIGVVMGAGASLHASPDGEAVADLPGAEAVTVVGRNADASWLMALTLDGQQGWIKASDLVIFGVEELPDMTSRPAAATDAATADDGLSITGATEAAATDAITVTAASPALPVLASSTPTDTVESASSTNETMAPEAAMSGAANVSGARLNIRSGPGSNYRIIGKASGGEELAIAARSEDGAWLVIVRDDLPQGAGWVFASLVRLDGEASNLPVSDSIYGAVGGPAPVAAPAMSTPAPTARAATTTADEAPSLPTAAPTAAATPTPSAQPSTRATGPTGLSGNIVFQDGRGGIYVYDLARGDVRFLISGFDPAISRDGKKVAFLRDGIYSINLDGSAERKIYSGNELITSPKWSPDGQWIVFSRLLGEYQCWDTEFFGCISVRQLSARFPRIPPGILQKIFLSQYERISLPNFGLSRVNADGKEFRDIAALDSAQTPDWNEDGIVYQSKAGLEITADTPDGDTRSVQNGNWDWDPDWAPNGGRIVYQSRQGSHWQLFSINPDGTGEFALTRPMTTLVDQLPSNVAAAFSYDGQHIVYLSNRDERNDAGPWRLWVMNADGGNQRPLPFDIEIDYGFGGEQVADWGR
jgi:Tol biopolymer transport system component/uncharacterized protein YraI